MRMYICCKFTQTYLSACGCHLERNRECYISWFTLLGDTVVPVLTFVVLPGSLTSESSSLLWCWGLNSVSHTCWAHALALNCTPSSEPPFLYVEHSLFSEYWLETARFFLCWPDRPRVCFSCLPCVRVFTPTLALVSEANDTNR